MSSPDETGRYFWHAAMQTFCPIPATDVSLATWDSYYGQDPDLDLITAALRSNLEMSRETERSEFTSTHPVSLFHRIYSYWHQRGWRLHKIHQSHDDYAMWNILSSYVRAKVVSANPQYLLNSHFPSAHHHPQPVSVFSMLISRGHQYHVCLV